MKNPDIFAIGFLFITLVTNGAAQVHKTADIWNWITPLKTKRNDVEKVFGSSITDDKTHPYQTYQREFGKITVVYAAKTGKLKDAPCVIEKDTVVNYSISPRKLFLVDLSFDLSSFKKDVTYSPREIVYFSENLGILIDTTVSELQGKSPTEPVIMLEYRAPENRVCPK